MWPDWGYEKFVGYSSCSVTRQTRQHGWVPLQKFQHECLAAPPCLNLSPPHRRLFPPSTTS
ncbi:hypothetical protein A2U01_0101887, partial [Trifolium medium]|nr:hypothetical protein [Trifolium medium]